MQLPQRTHNVLYKPHGSDAGGRIYFCGDERKYPGTNNPARMPKPEAIKSLLPGTFDEILLFFPVFIFQSAFFAPLIIFCKPPNGQILAHHIPGKNKCKDNKTGNPKKDTMTERDLFSEKTEKKP